MKIVPSKGMILPVVVIVVGVLLAAKYFPKFGSYVK